MSIENMRSRPFGHEVIEISDDDDVVEVAPIPRRRVGGPPRSPDHSPADRDLDGDSPMQDYRRRNDQGQLELPPHARPHHAVPIIPLQRARLGLSASPDRQQHFKRKRSKSPPDRLPAKRPLFGDREDALHPDPRPFNRLIRNQDNEMFEAKLVTDLFGEPLAAAPAPVPLIGDSVPPAAEFPGHSKEACLEGVLVLFPDILPDHVSNLWDSKPEHRSVERLVNLILQEADDGRPFPKVANEAPAIKQRQRHAAMAGDDPAKKYMAKDRPLGDAEYNKESINYLGYDFPFMPKNLINAEFAAAGFFLYPAYLALYEIDRQWFPEQPNYSRLQKPRPLPSGFKLDNLEWALHGRFFDPAQTAERMQELKDARAAKCSLKARYDREEANDRAERENEESARALGTISECGCCFSEYPLNRMVHCSNEGSIHFFCRECAKRNAETEIGQGKYVLVCMSMDGCSAGFDREQRDLFMDANLKIALERIETEHNLRMAGIENLESCPFCPYAAEYPPISEERIFRCVHPDCGLESCRLCNKISHIPKTCKEFAKESGADSHRRRLEDAMSEALVRKCNKCKTPFIKMDGCNKITCTKCRNIQCYICSQDCLHTPHGGTYAHFNDPSRGGKEGQCQLFDNTEQRHQEAVEAAQKEAMAKIQAEHPEYTEDELKATIVETAASKEDRERRARLDPMAARFGGLHAYGYGPVDFDDILGELRVRRRPRWHLAGPFAPPEEMLAELDAARRRLAVFGERHAAREGGGVFHAVPRDFFLNRRGEEAQGPANRNPRRGVAQVRDRLPNGVRMAHDHFYGNPAPPASVPAPRIMLNQRIEAGNLPRGPHLGMMVDPRGVPVENIRGPPPPFDPAHVIEHERAQAQDRALREAYLRAPAAVQARRRDQMRKLMKEPHLDDAAVERAILQAGEADVKEGAALAFPPRYRAREVLDRLQRRSEELEDQQPREPPPFPVAAQNFRDQDDGDWFEVEAYDDFPVGPPRDGVADLGPNNVLPQVLDGQSLQQYHPDIQSNNPQDPPAVLSAGNEARQRQPEQWDLLRAAERRDRQKRLEAQLARLDDEWEFGGEAEMLVDQLAQGEAAMQRHRRADAERWERVDRLFAQRLQAERLDPRMEDLQQRIVGQGLHGDVLGAAGAVPLPEAPGLAAPAARRPNFLGEIGELEHFLARPARAPRAQAPDEQLGYNAALALVDPMPPAIDELLGDNFRPWAPIDQRQGAAAPLAALSLAGAPNWVPPANGQDPRFFVGPPRVRRRRVRRWQAELSLSPPRASRVARAENYVAEDEDAIFGAAQMLMHPRPPGPGVRVVRAADHERNGRNMAIIPDPPFQAPLPRIRSPSLDARAWPLQPGQNALGQMAGDADASPDLARSSPRGQIASPRADNHLQLPDHEDSNSENGDLASIGSSSSWGFPLSFPPALAVRPRAEGQVPLLEREDADAGGDIIDDHLSAPSLGGQMQRRLSTADAQAARQLAQAEQFQMGAESIARVQVASDHLPKHDPVPDFSGEDELSAEEDSNETPVDW